MYSACVVPASCYLLPASFSGFEWTFDESEASNKHWCCAVFTNRIEDLRLQDLAEVDLREMIYQVQEFFGDFAVLDPHHFAVPIQQNQVTLQPFTWDYSRR